MDNRRRQNWDRNRRSQNRRPPRGNWQPIVPSWEKEFCRVVGSLDWETLLQTKKFIHLYKKVLKWDDSEGEKAFSNAKKRFWAEINGLPCDISLPDPNRYIDTIDWDSEIDYEPDLEFEPVISNPEDPVIIFGDSLIPNQAYSITGWGDEEENFKLPANSSSANNDHGAQWEQNWADSFANNPSANNNGDQWEQNWGDSFNNNPSANNNGTQWEQNWGDSFNNNPSSNNNGAQWEQNWGDSFDNGAPIGWPGDSNNACHFGDEDGWNNDRGWNNEWGWNNDSNNMNNKVGPDIEHKIVVDGEQGQWNDSNFTRGNIGRQVPRGRGQDRHKTKTSRNHYNGRKKTTYNSCGPVTHNAAITVGQKWNR